MITGIGIDIVQINRMESWINNPKLTQRYFHPDELVYISSRLNSAAQTLAARFAAKEAFGKALGTGLKGIALKDILTINNENGKPELKLSGSALNMFNKSGSKNVHVSLSHEKETAIAMIILEA